MQPDDIGAFDIRPFLLHVLPRGYTHPSLQVAQQSSA